MKKYKIDFKLPCKASYICLTSDLCQLVQRGVIFQEWCTAETDQLNTRLFNSAISFNLCWIEQSSSVTHLFNQS